MVGKRDQRTTTASAATADAPEMPTGARTNIERESQRRDRMCPGVASAKRQHCVAGLNDAVGDRTIDEHLEPNDPDIGDGERRQHVLSF